MYILLLSVIIKSIFNTTATCRAQLLEMNLSESVEEVLSKLFPAVRAGQQNMQIVHNTGQLR